MHSQESSYVSAGHIQVITRICTLIRVTLRRGYGRHKSKRENRFRNKEIMFRSVIFFFFWWMREERANHYYETWKKIYRKSGYFATLSVITWVSHTSKSDFVNFCLLFILVYHEVSSIIKSFHRLLRSNKQNFILLFLAIFF